VNLTFGDPSSFSTWKFNNGLLSNESFVNEVESILDDFINNNLKSFSDYESLKFRIKKLAIEFETFQRLKRKYELIRLQKLFGKDGSDSKDLFLQMVKYDLSTDDTLHPDILIKKLKSVRSDIDVCSLFPDKPDAERMGMFYDFYSKILKHDDVRCQGLAEYFEQLPIIEEKAQEDLSSPISVEEIEKAIPRLNLNSSPGLDGLSSEFFMKCRERFAKILLWLWMKCVESSKMPRSLRQGVICLIYKKGDPSSLKNWRPITLSNTDFKIFAIVLKFRFESVLTSIIGPWQTCGIPGRSIFNNLSCLRDNLLGVNGALLSLDQENAYPNVDHKYMIKVLEAFGFPQEFRNYVDIMYSSIFVHVNTGKGLTKLIPFEKGVKQGDPMASALYGLCLEPLLKRLSLRMLELAPSLFIYSPGTNLSVYADDTVPIISHMGQFRVVQEELKLYGNFSGGRASWEKCEIFPLGSWSQLDFPSHFKVSREGVKIL
jgi:hypothetical protein